MKRYIFGMVVAVVAVSAGCNMATAQQRNVIRGLEGNEEYLTLVDEESALVRRGDSLSQVIGDLRRELRADTLGRAEKSAAIMKLERESFGMRNMMADVAGRINAIEQDWIMRNLRAELPEGDRGGSSEVLSGSLGISGGAGNSGLRGISVKEWFERNLSGEQLDELRRAREAEPEIPGLIVRYIENHSRIRVLAGEYESASDAAIADSIRTKFEAAAMEGSRLDEVTRERWEMIFDSKSYIYNLLADKENRADLLARWESGLEQMRQERQGLDGDFASEAVVDYLLQKRMLAEYETVLADELGNGAAADSLRRAAAALPRLEELEELRPVRLRERLFFDYADIKIGGSPYSASNPIPEVRVFPRGIVRRVLVGAFSTVQSPSVFRQAWPLAHQKGEDGKHRYFLGGFPTDSLAEVAVEQMRKAGFRAPAVVVWVDGVYIDPRDDESDAEKVYRIEISGLEELPARARETIRRAVNAPAGGEGSGSGAEGGSASGLGGDIAKSGGGFVVAPLDARTALRLRLALEEYAKEVERKAAGEADARIVVKLVKVAG